MVVFKMSAGDDVIWIFYIQPEFPIWVNPSLFLNPCVFPSQLFYAASSEFNTNQMKLVNSAVSFPFLVVNSRSAVFLLTVVSGLVSFGRLSN